MLSLAGALELSGEEEEKDERSSPRCLSNSWAFFSVSTLETHQRLGILARFLQWPVKWLVWLEVWDECNEKVDDMYSYWYHRWNILDGRDHLETSTVEISSLKLRMKVDCDIKGKRGEKHACFT